MNRTRLFVASCISLLTTSMVFSIRGDIEGDLSGVFMINKQQMGEIWLPAFWGFTISIILGGSLVDFLGMRRLLSLSGFGFIIGVLMVIFAPRPEAQVENIFANTGTLILFSGFFVMGLAQGLVEGVINPLIATIYSDKKTHMLNILHAWWPGGLVIGGLAAFGLTKLNASLNLEYMWQIKLGLIIIPSIVYLIMIFGQEFPKTERVSSGVSTKAMFKETTKPLFIVLFLCMWLTAASELGPDQWMPSVMGKLVKLEGILFLVYTAGLMFVMRHFAGPIAHKISPIGLLIFSSIFSGLGLLWLSFAQSAFMAFAAATVFGIGKSYFWPTMLGVTSERFPKGGPLLMAVMGGAGMLSVGLVLPIMGAAYDKAGPEWAFRYIAILPAVLLVVFVIIFLADKAKGGYRAEELSSASEGAEETAPGSDAPAESSGDSEAPNA